jgi:hypothetical protein
VLHNGLDLGGGGNVHANLELLPPFALLALAPLGQGAHHVLGDLSALLRVTQKTFERKKDADAYAQQVGVRARGNHRRRTHKRWGCNLRHDFLKCLGYNVN